MQIFRQLFLHKLLIINMVQYPKPILYLLLNEQPIATTTSAQISNCSFFTKNPIKYLVNPKKSRTFARFFGFWASK